MSSIGTLATRYAALGPVIYVGLTLAGAAYVSASILGLTGIGGCDGPIVSCDAAAYYFTEHGPYNWDAAPDGVPPYRYAPAFLWVIAPFKVLSFDAFVWVWAALHLIVLLWLRAGWMLAVPGLNEDVIRGNVNVFVAALLVIGIRRASAWVPVILTKVTPVIGLSWHLARKEWRSVAVSLLMVAGVIGVGFVVQPGLWEEWVRSLSTSPDNYAGIDNGLPIVLRIPVGIVVIVLGALRSQAWLLPVGVLVGWPGIMPPAFAVLAAIPRLRSHGKRSMQNDP